VATHLLTNGEKQDHGDGSTAAKRHTALVLLCRMNPGAVARVRSLCVDLCRMPSLALHLTCVLHADHNDPEDTVAFMSGLLLGSDPQVRSWISFFVRNAQKRHNKSLTKLRGHMKRYLETVMVAMRAPKPRQCTVVSASSLLRLYAALRGIAGMKFDEEEATSLFELITARRPPLTPAGSKLLSLSLCTLIACASIVSGPDLQRRAVEFIRRLVQDEEMSSSTSSASTATSFGEMLLLMAIHFHSQQLSAVSDLVCQTLGMKIAVRNTNLTNMRNIFTQEVFNEQVVAAHAVRVAVTEKLSASTQGFLPVHCIHQLLKSRAFSKNKVPVNGWIYRQICSSSAPIHPVLPALVEVYVNSVLVPPSGRGQQPQQQPISEMTNEPISERDIKAVFADDKGGGLNGPFGAPAQLLTLYYVLLHDSVRLSGMRGAVVAGRRPKAYSSHLIAALPIRRLLRVAERERDRYGLIFPQLLRLCLTQFPHLCLTQDWLEEEASAKDFSLAPAKVATAHISSEEAKEAMSSTLDCPSRTMRILRTMLRISPEELWPDLADILVESFPRVLADGVCRQIQGKPRLHSSGCA